MVAADPKAALFEIVRNRTAAGHSVAKHQRDGGVFVGMGVQRVGEKLLLVIGANLGKSNNKKSTQMSSDDDRLP